MILKNCLQISIVQITIVLRYCYILFKNEYQIEVDISIDPFCFQNQSY